MRLLSRNIRGFDFVLFSAVFLLVIIGLSSIYSVGLSDPGTKMSFFYHQLIFFVIGLSVMSVFAFLDYRFLKAYYKVFLILAILALFGVLIFSRAIRGSNAWFSLFGFQFQPVEMAKIFLVIFLSAYLSRKAKEFYFSWKPVFISGIAAFSVMGLVLLQPDMGSALIIFAIWFFMILFTNMDKKKIMIMLFAMLLVLSMGWFGFLKDYQKERVLTLFDPGKDPLGIGYNLTQAVTAVGSGQFFGRGFGLGSQSQLNFLPEQWTDFIFAVISEEFGFIGAMIVVGLIFTILLRISNIIKNSNDNFAIFLALGFLIMFFVQSSMNILMNIGSAPVIGVPLPFVSYGGSSIIMCFMAIGILESILLHKAEY